MSARVWIDGNAPRIICSKAGYEADPSLSNEHKTFDSNWFTGGGIRWKLHHSVNGRFTQPAFMPFPFQLDYVPRVQVFGYKQWWGVNDIFPSRNMVPLDWWWPPNDGFARSNEFMDPDYQVTNAGVTIQPISGSFYSRIDNLSFVAFVYGD